MKYKAVIFDLFGTLVNKFPVHESLDVLREMAKLLEVDADGLISLWHDTFNDRHSGCFENLEEDILYVSQQLGVRPSDEIVKQAAKLDLDYVAANIFPKDGALELLEYLHENGIKLALVSNWSDEVPTVWPDIPISKFFDVSVFSCRVQIMKPDPRIYQMALEQLGVESKDCLYVGDGDSGEIAGAEESGMDAVLIGETGSIEWHGKAVSSLSEIRKLVE